MAAGAHAPPESLVQSFRWAEKTLEWCQKNAAGSWLMTMDTLPTSSWFSGFGCAELAMDMLNQARRNCGAEGIGFSPSYQFEIALKGRTSSSDRLPAHTCQHLDILRMLCEKDRNELKELEKTCTNPSEEIWNFLCKKEFVKEEVCSRHKMRNGGRKRQNRCPDIYIEDIVLPLYSIWLEISCSGFAFASESNFPLGAAFR
jgi:hypothetical protein